jgi:integrase
MPVSSWSFSAAMPEGAAPSTCLFGVDQFAGGVTGRTPRLRGFADGLDAVHASEAGGEPADSLGGRALGVRLRPSHHQVRLGEHRRVLGQRQKARTKAKLPELTFHTLRYFYISMVRAQGLPNAITEQLVGHVDERTHRGYTRPIPGTEPLIRAALASAFGSARKRPI